MEKLYNDPDILFIFRNGLQTLMLSYTTQYIINQDENILKYFKELMAANNNQFQNKVNESETVKMINR